MNTTQEPEWLLPAEIGKKYRVNPKSLARWAKAGNLPEGAVLLTPGGHHRYNAAIIHAYLTGQNGRPQPHEPWMCPGCNTPFVGERSPNGLCGYCHATAVVKGARA